MSWLLEKLMTDQNIAPQFKRQFSDPYQYKRMSPERLREIRDEEHTDELLDRALEKAEPRRFSGEPPTGFGSLE